MDAVTAHGHASIKKGSKSFALASRVLPPELRDDASMLYAWCRYCDDVIDGQDMGHGQIADYKDGQGERLAELTRLTHASLAGEPTDNPIFAGLARVFNAHNIPHIHADELLRGFQMDADDRIYKTVDDILDYSYHVAGVVGVMMGYIMGVRNDATLDRASDLGLAFQLTNIARDVVDDAEAGRVFVPQDLLLAAGAPIDAASLAQAKHWPVAHKAACAQLVIAETYYASAKVGVKALPFRCAWAISAALMVYREIGETLRLRGPEAWEQRVSASTGRKLWLALTALGPTLGRKRTKITPRHVLYERPKL